MLLKLKYLLYFIIFHVSNKTRLIDSNLFFFSGISLGHERKHERQHNLRRSERTPRTVRLHRRITERYLLAYYSFPSLTKLLFSRLQKLGTETAYRRPGCRRRRLFPLRHRRHDKRRRDLLLRLRRLRLHSHYRRRGQESTKGDTDRHNSVAVYKLPGLLRNVHRRHSDGALLPTGNLNFSHNL